MAKLYFKHGCVTSSKTLNLLSVAHNYTAQGKNVYLIKPKIDIRFGIDKIESKAGLSKNADLITDINTNIFEIISNLTENISCILVDEVQFLEEQQIEQLRIIASELNIPVMCYGLRTDFKTKLFPGSKRLIELADSIEEIKTTCYYCTKKGICNLKQRGNEIITDGETIELGCEDLYYSTCFKCYNDKSKYLKY